MTEPINPQSPSHSQPETPASQSTNDANGKRRRLMQALRAAVRYHMKYSMALEWKKATNYDIFMAVALAVRERMIDGMMATEKRYQKLQVKRVFYLSMEFLMGQLLRNNLYNLGIYHWACKAAAKMKIDLEAICDTERDAALGNGGLGRLAACLLDSMATLDMPGFGYGINYEFGLFKQEIVNGHQREQPDSWSRESTPWLIERNDRACLIPIYGKMVEELGQDGKPKSVWLDWKLIIGVPHDMPIVGYDGETVNFLRLFTARASSEFDMEIFNQGDYLKAMADKVATERISKVLYPSDAVQSGKELRLVQEYFLVACALRDIVSAYREHYKSFDNFPEKIAMQLNDTHPALAVAEMMRILLDEYEVPWDKAWQITESILGFTNHTLLPEALERWTMPLMELVLPRHLQIILEINQRFLQQVARVWPHDAERARRMSIIEEGEPKQVRMAHLAMIGSHSINGVAELHTELVKKTLVPDFYELWPHKFNNKTNGVTPRRWLQQSNPRLTGLLNRTIGETWVTDLERLRALEPFVEDAAFQEEFMAIKRGNKARLARVIQHTNHLTVSPDAVFDIQVKRFHEYKRQLLNAMHIMHQYLTIVEDGKELEVPKTYIIAGKAAPGYFMAKLIIKLINNIAEVVNHDRRVQDQMKVVFVPDYRVSLAEKIMPAADLSEQISTAGKEASGTGNMKFAMNGALTIGTLDGANIEIRDEVGAENIYIFGLTAEQVAAMRQNHSYQPQDYYLRSPAIRRVIDSLRSNRFCEQEPDLFRPIHERLMQPGEEYFHIADFESYAETHLRAAREYTDKKVWARKAILNVARIGKFSSDRTVMEYARDIWDIHPLPPEGVDEDDSTD
ncbi:MAG: Maltodextrin phosphorylase [bacterium]|nr:Maltodextrin phosphorylase [bacterium]